MTADECRELKYQWERARSHRPASVWDKAGPASGTTDDTPDLGSRFARWMAGAIPPQSSRLHVLLRKKEYANISYAIQDLSKTNSAGRCGAGVRRVREAGILNGCPARGPLLKAALFATDATIASVAAALEISAEVVKAFNDLYFNVDERRGEVAFRRAVVGGIRCLSVMYPGHQRIGTDLATMIEIAEHGTLEEVLAESGIGRDSMSEEAILRRSRRRILRTVEKASAAMSSGQSPAASAAPIFKLVEQFKGEDAGASRTGSLHDPFLESLLQDSDNHQEDFRRQGEADAMKSGKTGGDPNQDPVS